MSTFPASTIKEIADSLGIPNLKDEVASSLAQDVEYRIHEIVQEAMKFMRHSKRTKLTVDDIDNALRVRNVEPLYGFSAPDGNRFRRTTVATNDLYFVEDEELDFETILSTPLPKVPLDVRYTAHWLAIEGVQPAIAQNPAPVDSKTEIFSKRIKLDQSAQTVAPGIKPTNTTQSGQPGQQSQQSLAAGAEVKPLVKHVLSKELQMYYERIASAVQSSDEVLRATGISSLQNDPGLHQLLPYFVQLVAEKVTQNIRNLAVLQSMMAMVRALLDNENLFVEPYLHQLMPAIMTCIVGKRLGESLQEDHWSLRLSAVELVYTICTKFGSSYHTLRPRVTRTFLRAFMDPEKPLTTHYGAIIGLTRLGDEVFKTLMVPNLKTYMTLVTPYLGRDMDMDEDGISEEVANRRNEGQHCVEALVTGLKSLIKHEIEAVNGAGGSTNKDLSMGLVEVREKLVAAIGVTLATALLKNQEEAEGNVVGIMAVINAC